MVDMSNDDNNNALDSSPYTRYDAGRTFNKINSFKGTM